MKLDLKSDSKLDLKSDSKSDSKSKLKIGFEIELKNREDTEKGQIEKEGGK